MSGECILVVEDHRSMLQAIKGILEAESYTVLTATDGLRALQVMEESLPELILADIMMPRMDGFALYEAVRARPEWVPIPFVFLTARSEREDRLKGKELGAEDYITKPFDAEELLVSVRSRLERACAIQQASEASFDQLKNQIVTVLGHELRTPLTYVMGYTDLALEEVASLTPAEVEDFLSGIKAGADRLNRLVRDLLLLVQIDSGRAAEEFEALAAEHDNLNEIVESTAKQFVDQAERHQAALEVVTGFGIPPVRLCEPYFVDALGRLIDNGIKFSTGPTKQIKVTTKAYGDWVSIAVSDRGLGIPEDQITHVLERFRQIDRRRKEQQGVGLGLAIADELISLHGGRIAAESTPGEGSTFTILLPSAVGR